MARGFGARESSTGAIIRSPDRRIGDLETRALLRMANVMRMEASGMKRSVFGSLRELKSEAQSATKAVEIIKELRAEVAKGNMEGMYPKKRGKSAPEDFAAKTMVAQELIAKGVKIGPDRDELPPDKLFNDLKAATGREHVVSWNKDGKYMFGMTGTKDRIKTWSAMEVSDHPLGYTNYRGFDWHNHPLDDTRVYGFLPSSSDVAGLIAGGMDGRAISAVEGTYVLKVTPELRTKLDSLPNRSAVYAVAKAAMAAWKQSIQRGLFSEGNGWSTDKEKADRIFPKSIKEAAETGKRMGIEFEFIPRPGFEHLAP